MGRNAHCSPAERQRILDLRKTGLSYRKISGILKCSVNMVKNALHYVQKPEKRGKSRKTSETTDRKIVTTSKKDPFLSSKDIVKELNLNISSSTVRKRLIENNLHGRVARKVPLLTKKHVKARMKFAMDHTNWDGPDGIKKWRNVLWSDETKINLRGSDGKLFVRRPENNEFKRKFTKTTVKYGGGGIMVWGCFSWDGVGPIFWIQNYPMNQDGYIDILNNVMLPYADWNMPLKWVYQQDNDPKHTAKKVKNWFSTKKVQVMEWPAQSPDLNPIENLWKDVKTAVGHKRTNTKEELWREIQNAWKAIPVQKCRQLILSMPNRCKAVTENHGYSTKY